MDTIGQICYVCAWAYRKASVSQMLCAICRYNYVVLLPQDELQGRAHDLSTDLAGPMTFNPVNPIQPAPQRTITVIFLSLSRYTAIHQTARRTAFGPEHQLFFATSRCRGFALDSIPMTTGLSTAQIPISAATGATHANKAIMAV